MKKGKYLAPGQPSPRLGWLWVLVALLIVALLLGAWFWLSRQEPADDDWDDDEEATTLETEPSEEPTQPTEPVIPDVQETQMSETEKQARQILAGMTQEEKVYQLFIVQQEQITGVGTAVQSGETTRQAIEKYPVGGIIYFSKNLETREQTAAMIEGIQSYSKLGLFISVDEEGGPVVRLADNASMGIKWFDAMLTIGNTGDTQKAYEVGSTIGSQISELGFNLDFAPVADVFSNPNNTVIGKRAFSDDPEVAAQMVAACVEGFNDSGILCTLKHFPGHGDTGEDSHYGAAKSNKTLEELRECEFLPFQAGIDAGAPVIMIGHITLPNVTEEDLPATLSKEIITGILREELGYEGLVITDAMNMGAITNHYSSGEAAVLAMQAGVDMILMPNDLTDSVDGILEALENGELTQEQIDEKVLRILMTKIDAGIIQPE